MGFPRQEYWSGLPFLSPGDLSNPGIEPMSSASWADFLPFYHWVTWEAHRNAYMYVIRVILKAHKQTRWTESKALKLSLWPVSVLRGEEGAKQGRSQLQLLLCPPVATLSPCSLLAMMWVLNSLMPMMVLQLIPFVKVKCTNLKCLGMFLDSLFGTYLTEGKRTANSCHYSQSPMRAGIKNFFSRKTDFKAVD